MMIDVCSPIAKISEPTQSATFAPALTTTNAGLERVVMAESKPILRTVEVKLYPTKKQIATLEEWMRVCCWIYNRLLEHRTKAYGRRGESSSFYGDCELLTRWRSRMPRLRAVPLRFLRDAAGRIDEGFAAFFRRVKAGERPGYPRFKSSRRWHSLECLRPGQYVRGRFAQVPKLGKIRCRGGSQKISETQKLLRIVRRASGWYAQVLFEDGVVPPKAAPIKAVGIDLGLESFATLSTGEHVENPRCFRKSESELATAQRSLAHKAKGSANRQRAVNRVAKIYECVAAQRKDFCHQLSRRLVNEFDAIAHESLNIRGLGRTRFAKSIHDVAWGMFISMLTVKAENAGRHCIAVDPRGTSQECPRCGWIQKKELSERHHRCRRCKFRCQRDVASALVIRARGIRAMVSSSVEGSTATRESLAAPLQVVPMKQAALF